MLESLAEGRKAGGDVVKELAGVQTGSKEQHFVCSSEFPLVDDSYRTPIWPKAAPSASRPAPSHIPQLALPFMAS